MKRKIDQLDLIKIKNLRLVKDPVKRWKDKDWYLNP